MVKNLNTHLTTTPENKLLLACLKSPIETTQEIKEVFSQEIDWDNLISTANLHGVLPLIYTILRTNSSQYVPEDKLKILKDQYLINTQRNLVLSAELLKILDLFESNGIEVIPLKGPVFAESIYGNLSLRQFVDLDILVRKREVLRAKKLLFDFGYQLIKDLPVSEEKYLEERNDFEFLNEQKIRVELHWTIISKIYHFPIEPGQLWDNLRKVNFSGREVLNFSSEKLLVFHCIHAGKHNWKKLKWICDAAKLVETQELDWDFLIKYAKEIGSERILLLGLYLANDVCGVVLPEGVQTSLDSNRAIHGLAKKVHKWLFVTSGYEIHKTPVFRIKSRERLTDKVVVFFRNAHWLLAPNEKDRAFISLPSFLSFCYYLIKPIRLLAEYGVGFAVSLKRK